MGVSALAIGFSIVGIPAAQAATVTFDDPNLQAAVNTAMNAVDGSNRAPDAPIDDADPALTQITYLNATGDGITNLTGIESLTGLKSLILQNNGLDDSAASHLAAHANELPDLELLQLRGNPNITENGIIDIADSELSLAELTISNTGVSASGADDMIAAVANHQGGLTGLGAAGLPLGDAATEEIAANLTSLTSLVLSDTYVTDAGIANIAASLPDLDTLWLNNTAVTDAGLEAISSNLAKMQNLYLSGAQITDISPLNSTSAPLSILNLRDQESHAVTVVAGQATDNPVRDENGDSVTITSSDPGFNYDSNTDTWTFDTPGTKTLTWSTTANIGIALDFETVSEDITFSGTIYQTVGVSLPAPNVTQPMCTEDGSVTAPTVDVEENDNIEAFIYRVNDELVDDLSEVGPGDDVVIIAWPVPEFNLVPDNGWEFGGDGELIYTVSIDEAPDCEPVPDEGDEDDYGNEPEPSESDDDEDDNGEETPAPSDDKQTPESIEILPETGTETIFPLAAGLALLLTGGSAVLIARRQG